MNIEVKLLQGQELFREKFINAVSVPPINAVGMYAVWGCVRWKIDKMLPRLVSDIKKRTLKREKHQAILL